MNYKVYVTLGFHINFYHSWRGDTPDEAGFGTDIRIVREILKMLDRANAAGQKARGYWDAEVYWTFQDILPQYAPDIIDGIRRRVEAGRDEIVVGPFNNGANHAATTDEFRAAVAWSIANEWGSGLKQMFGRVAPIYRSQETMFTIGQEQIFRDNGLDGQILYYAGVPFNTISSFMPRLSDEQRYNPFWFRSREDQPRLIGLPCIAAGDLIEETSLESLMLKLHQKQLRGEIQSDVLIHLNEDADLETWLPTLKWFPNMGGLDEFIRVVNKYPWADFTVPSEYLAAHPPTHDVIVRQDLADGGYDGNYSWAEKCASLRLWTLLEQSRLASYRAAVLAKRAGQNVEAALWTGLDSAFFQRLIGLTTTHFGMSTPIINEERQNKAYAILGRARHLALETERAAARACQQPDRSDRPDRPVLYDLELFPTPPGRDVPPAPTPIPISLPIVLTQGVDAIVAEDQSGRKIAVSLTDVEPLPDGRNSARLRFSADFQQVDHLRIKLQPARSSAATAEKRLKNQWLDVVFSEQQGIETFTCNGQPIGAASFLDPFVTYDKRTFRATGYEFLPLNGETWAGLQRVRLRARIPMQTHAGEYVSEFTYTFTLFDELPYLLVDVEARYAYTPPQQVIHNLTQKLRRLMDLRWIETAPFQLTPALSAPAAQPLRVWKHNYLGITAYYDLNYGQINPRNRNVAAFNHQVTAGWVAVSNGQQGLLIGEDAQSLASMAFCPMRLRERDGLQTVSLNPFGSYYGKQLDYSHLGGNGNGTGIMQAFSGALQPNGPSFNGETLRFSLMLAPYSGDEPSAELQAAAAAHFYPPGIIVHAAPIEAATLDDIERVITAERDRAEWAANRPLMPPTAFLVNPSANAVDLVWAAPRQCPITGYDIHWRYATDTEWQSISIEALTRWHIDGLQDGRALHFKMRSRRADACSDWTPEQTCAPGAVTDSSVLAMFRAVPPWTLVKVLATSLWSLLRIR